VGVVRQYLMVAADGRAEELLGALRALSSAVEALPGSQGVDLLRDIDRPERFVFIERWVSMDAHKAGAGALPKALIGAVMAPLAMPLDGAYLASA
jgi:heme oxygenase (mycobilin-producing)